MECVRTIDGVRARVREWRRAGETIGLVPTMGALHRGHLALVARSRARCARTVATLFVNPTQFASSEDFDRYPREEARDAELLERDGCDLLFAPDARELYPNGASIPEQFKTTVHVHDLSDGLCGAHRPGHFIGSATVVMKLLMIAAPDIAYFGQKDFQQLQVVRRMVRDLNVDAVIEAVDTVREPDGLALSSRNAYLSPAERTIAPSMYAVLRHTLGCLRRTGDVAAATGWARQALVDQGFRAVDYVTLVDRDTLEPIACAGRAAQLLAAAWLGRTRLIDNLAWPDEAPAD